MNPWLVAALIVAGGASHSVSIWAQQKPASGTFDVKLTPDKASAFGRQVIEKQYHGDLAATAKAEMLSAMGNVEGSGTYVAIEKVSGTLGGKKGEFSLHHVGTMTRGKQSLTINVIPDSGTGELTGLTGSMTIDIKDGKHFYTFSYQLPKAQ